LGKGYEPIVFVSTKQLQDKIKISVQDNGMGISKSVEDKIFQPFFST
jgi:two-component system NtrC family sensor kinase